MKLHLKPFYTTMCLLFLLTVAAFPVPRGYSQDQPAWEGQIAYVGADGNLWLVRGENPQPFQLTSDASEQRRYNSPLFSPEGDMLAYCRDDNAGAGPAQIYLMRSGSWQPILVADGAYCSAWPRGSFSWSPDGLQIAYSRPYAYAPQADGSQWSQYQGIWVADIVSGSSGELVPPPGTNPLVLPMWSPDGKWLRLYELVSAEGLGVLRTWEKETGALYNWLDIGADIFAGFADWSPDSSRLVFDEAIYIGYPGAGLFTATPGAADLKEIYTNTGDGALQPLWSPDGSLLAFLLRVYGDNEQSILATSKPDGSELLWVFSSPASLGLLDWSPDSQQLLFTSTESTEGGPQTGIFIYDLASQSVLPLVNPANAQADWGPVPSVERPAAGAGGAQLTEFKAQGSPLAYLASNYQLMLFDPKSGEQLELSPPLAALDYWVSPSSTKVIYGNRLVSLEFREGGQVALRQTPLPNTPANDQVAWSPKENRLAVQDADGRVWMVDASGDYVEIPGASGLPAWSSDERYLSYCTDGDRLWVVGGGVSLRELASPVDCGVQWSPSQPLLAYIQQAADGVSTLLHIYDAERGISTALMEGVEIDSWSPDGELLAVRRVELGSGNTYTVYAVDPRQEKSLELGQFDPAEAGMARWGAVEEDYLFGSFQFSKRLNESQKIAETLFDIGQRGNILLAGQSNDPLLDVVCLDVSSGDARILLSANLSGLPRAERPGVWSRLSPDAAWTSAYSFDPAGYRYLLTRCDRTRQVSIEVWPPGAGQDSGPTQYDNFSPDSAWYMQVVPGSEEQGQVLLYDLSTLERQSLPAPVMLGAPVTWVKAPPLNPEGTYAVNGVVKDSGGSPLSGVEIWVDGQAAGMTDADGFFTIAGLEEGKHSLSVKSGDTAFEPQEILLSLPGEAEDVIFTAVPSQAELQETQAEPTETVNTAGTQEAGAALPTEGSATPAVEAAGQVEIFKIGAREIAAIMFAVTCLFIFLGLILLLVRFLAFRRKGPDTPAPQAAGTRPATAAGGTAAVAAGAASKSGPQAELDALLRQGVSEVKSGNPSAGLEKLKQVTQSSPESAVGWLWSGMAAARLRDWAYAEQCFNRAKDLGHPKGDEALKWLQSQKKGKNSH